MLVIFPGSKSDISRRYNVTPKSLISSLAPKSPAPCCHPQWNWAWNSWVVWYTIFMVREGKEIILSVWICVAHVIRQNWNRGCKGGAPTKSTAFFRISISSALRPKMVAKRKGPDLTPKDKCPRKQHLHVLISMWITLWYSSYSWC